MKPYEAAQLSFLTYPKYASSQMPYGYETDTPIKEAVRSIFGYDCQTVEVDNHFAIVMPWRGQHVIAVRGTDEPIDWLHNIMVRPEEFTDGYVHRGYGRAAEALTRAVQKAYPLGSDLILCGHSMGGAIAVCMSLILPRVKTIYTFGSPRALGPHLAGEVERYIPNIYRYENCNDLITLVPPVPMYYHVGQKYYIDSQENIHTKYNWVRYWIDFVRGKLKRPTLIDTLPAHIDYPHLLERANREDLKDFMN